MRAAMLTVMPRMLPSASTPPPSNTLPVCMPTRKSNAAAAVLPLDQLARRRPSASNEQARAHGALGVVLAGLVSAEHCQQAVACVLQDLAAVRLDDRGAARKRAIHHRVDVLGVELLA